MKNIFFKAAIGFLLVLSIFVGIFSIFQYSKHTILASVRSDLLNTIVEQSRESTRIFTNSHAILRGLSKDESVIRFLASSGEDRPSREVVEEILGHYNIQDYPSIYLIATSGICVAATDQTGKFLGNNYTFRDYFKKTIEGEPWTDMAMGSTTKLPGYYFSEPVRDHDGNIIGIAVAKLDGSVIDTSVTSSLSKSFKGDTFIVDSDGVVISSQLPERTFKTLALLSDEKKQELLTKNKFLVSEFVSLGFDAVQGALNNYSIPITIDFTDPSDKKDKVIAIKKISDSPFYLLMEIDQTAAFLSSGQKMFGTIAYIVMGIALMVIVGAAYVKVRANRRELGQQKIVQEQLEKTVSERTAELQMANDGLQREIDQRKKMGVELGRSNRELANFNEIAVGRELKMIELKKRIKELEKNAGLAQSE